MPQETTQKKKRKKEEKLEFEAGKVFSPGEAKDEDFDLEQDQESDRYKAQKGQGGDRGGGGTNGSVYGDE
jgi:hypothetical protein